MFSALTTALVSGSRDSWTSFALGIVAGLVLMLVSRRLRRKEDR